MTLDPVETNPSHYSTVFENDRVRVLEYRDAPGESTTAHDHPDSVMCTLTGFRRRLTSGDNSFEVQLPAGAAVWLPAQRHSGHNIGDGETHVMLIELKGGGADPATSGMLGPSTVAPDGDAPFESGHA
jgi:quercetin dioxygenase-like cupin family protein